MGRSEYYFRNRGRGINTTGTGLAEFDDDENDDDDDHVQDKLKECLDLMISLELIEKRENKDKSEYRILKDNNI